MSVYLVQHGKSLPKDKDPEKGLSEEGIAGAERIASVAGGYHVHVTRIVHSGKKRARQTAEIMASSLQPIEGVHEGHGLGPMDDIVPIADSLDGKSNHMFVGHLPFMSRLASYLITGSTERPVFKFQNGGILCLDENPEINSWIIRWSLMPDIS
jgi:phosphohistidine phosphatase